MHTDMLNILYYREFGMWLASSGNSSRMFGFQFLVLAYILKKNMASKPSNIFRLWIVYRL